MSRYGAHPRRDRGAMLLGVLAVFRKQLDLDIVIPALYKAAEDAPMKPGVKDSLDDVRHDIKLP